MASHETAPWLGEFARYAPTYAHLIFTAVFNIFAGAHASLARPSSAARRPRRAGKAPKADRRMEGLSPSDAIWYPLLTGGLLASLYFLLKWMDDPDILNVILNWYLSTFGAFSTARLLADSTSVGASFVFPDRFSDRRALWTVHARDRQARSAAGTRSSPVPHLPRLRLSAKLESVLWNLRNAVRRPFLVVDVYIRGVMDQTAAVYLVDVASAVMALGVGLWFNLVSRPWWLTNLLSFGFGYQALQLISPTTFWTGTLVLTSLFFYDIYFVFFTPMMIHVATKLDIPVKLQFPRPSRASEDPGKQPLAMLGLGDVVLPGIIMALALRFDLYLFYLRKQRPGKPRDPDDQKTARVDGSPSGSEEKDTSLEKASSGREKAVYETATGAWGERFWVGKAESRRLEGGVFPKPYFYASVGGYICGLTCTLIVMHTFKHGQPALLYLVPGVQMSLWGTAFVRGEIQEMWSYSEDVGPEAEIEKMTITDEKSESGGLKNAEPETRTRNSTDSTPDNQADREGKPGNSGSADGSLQDGSDGHASERSPTAKTEDRDTLIDFTLRYAGLGDEESEETAPLLGSDETKASN